MEDMCYERRRAEAGDSVTLDKKKVYYTVKGLVRGGRGVGLLPPSIHYFPCKCFTPKIT